jgi:hypothetical protein
MASKKPNLLENVQRIAASKPATAAGERQPSINYPISTQTPVGEPELPTLAGVLSDRLQDIARRYIGARRRSGEALLDAARWLSEARAEAQHGEWQVFLEATSTSDDTAERLLNIHSQAMQNPQFAESVRTNWIGQSVAALLARPSTPPEVVDEVLTSPAPPTVTEVQKKIRQARQAPASIEHPPIDLGEPQNPQFADFGKTAGQRPVQRVEAISADYSLQLLQEAAALVHHIASIADTIPGGTLAEQAVQVMEQAVVTIRRVLSQPTNDEV